MSAALEALRAEASGYLARLKSRKLTGRGSLRIARRELRTIEHRASFAITRERSGEYAVLLDLFIARRLRKRVSVSAAIASAPVPATTSLRAIGNLVAAGLVERVPHADDRRVVWLALTDDGDSCVDALLRAIGGVQ